MRRFKPYLQLVRLPNLFTAAADPLAGWFLVGGSLSMPGSWVPLMLAGVVSYAAGMILNDVFDFEVDKVERPGRPLPSGQVSRRLAGVVGAVLLLLAPALAALAGLTSFFVAVVLAACVLGYDGRVKRTALGPLIMGSCRALNLLLGMSLAAGLGGPTGWLAALGFGVFVAGVTWISRDEATAEAGQTRGVLAGMIVENVGLLMLLVAGFFVPTNVGGFPLLMGRAAGLIDLVAIASIISLADLRALQNPSPASFQAAVKTGVLSLIFLDVALVSFAGRPEMAALIACLWVPAFLLGRWLYST